MYLGQCPAHSKQLYTYLLLFLFFVFFSQIINIVDFVTANVCWVFTIFQTLC